MIWNFFCGHQRRLDFHHWLFHHLHGLNVQLMLSLIGRSNTRNLNHGTSFIISVYREDIDSTCFILNIRTVKKGCGSVKSTHIGSQSSFNRELQTFFGFLHCLDADDFRLWFDFINDVVENLEVCISH